MSKVKSKNRKVVKHEKFGTLLGVAPGNVNVYSSNYDDIDKQEFHSRQSLRNYVDGIFMGYKWQCVEFARRWMYLNKGYVFNDIAMAYDIFKLKSVADVKTSQTLPLKSFRNGSKRHPEPGCLLIWQEGGEFEITGHVAIVTEVIDNYIHIIEQNVDEIIWPENQNYSRKLKTNIDEFGGYWIACDYHDSEILGWVIQTDDGTYAEQIVDVDKKLFNIKLNTLELDDEKYKKSWLNVANSDEAAYVKYMHGHKLTTLPEDQSKYFCMSQTAYQELKRATNELHAMFMHATNFVLQNNNLFEKFAIPKAVWPKIQKSWDNRRNQMITGRFDFCISEEGIKVYEYNADSSSCYMECGKIQGKWAEHFGCKLGEDAGEDLSEKLIHAWEDSAVETDGLLHIMMDDDPEEKYHGLYMKAAIEEAGIRCKIIHGVQGLEWNSDHKIVDDENNEIKWVWKTWAWETALDQIRKECEEDDNFIFNFAKPNYRNSKPRLVDVLLKEGILVFEPLWTLITSNKAILPVLWELYPNYPYLLNSQFNLTDELIKTGYVTKPIAGRCGSNINLFDHSSVLINKTEGRFASQSQIYQELFKLPSACDKYNVQISTFTVAGSYSGACTRVDQSLVVTTESDIFPLRIVSDSEISE